MDTRSQTDEMKNAAQDIAGSLQEAGGEIQDRLGEFWETSKEKASACAKATDRTIREYPYQSIGIALGLGLITGLLLSRGRGNHGDED